MMAEPILRCVAEDADGAATRQPTGCRHDERPELDDEYRANLDLITTLDDPSRRQSLRCVQQI
jgi:hypothetical protein